MIPMPTASQQRQRQRYDLLRPPRLAFELWTKKNNGCPFSFVKTMVLSYYSQWDCQWYHRSLIGYYSLLCPVTNVICEARRVSSEAKREEKRYRKPFSGFQLSISLIMTIITDLLSRWEFYIAVFCVFFISRIIKWWFDPLRKIPGPRGIPILGNTLDFRQENDMHALLLQRVKEYGPIFKDSTVFTGPRVNIADPEVAKRVLVTNSANYYRDETLRNLLPGLGNGVLTANGRAHAIQRKHLNPAFSLESVKDYLPIFNEKGIELVKHWNERIKANGGKPVESEMLSKFTHFTLDVIGLCGFGYSFDCIMGSNSEESKATNIILTANFNILRRSLETMFPFLKWIPSKERDSLQRAESKFYGLIERIISKRRTEMKNSPGQTLSKNDLLQRLLNLYEESGEGISNKGLFHQMFTFLFAGHETTSLSLMWTVFMLAKNPKFQEKARKEVREVLEGGSYISFDDLDKLKFLDDCIKEAMRLYPVAIFTGRKPLKDEKIGPYVIQANTIVLILIGALNRNEKVWKNANEYNPDRFSKKGDGDPLFPYYFLPFSRGPRMCIGYRFAQMEMKVALAHLLNEFSFRLGKNQPEEIKGKLAVTLSPSPKPIIEISKAAR